MYQWIRGQIRPAFVQTVVLVVLSVALRVARHYLGHDIDPTSCSK
jgi:hypothetical protein